MKIFSVNSSPTTARGMTHILLDLFLEGAREAGAEVESVDLQKKKIGYCVGCLKCWVKTPGVCVQDDDMTELRQKFIEADYFVLGTPVYVDGMTAQAKTFLDRLIPLVDPYFEAVDGHCRHKKNQAKVPELVLLSVCGFCELDNFGGLVDHLQRISRNMQTRLVGSILRPAARILVMDKILPDQVKQIKQAARRAGKELVEQGSFSDQTLAEISQECIPTEIFIDGANLFWDRCIEAGKFPV
jgi:putative NADPH-quinone reductase